MARSRIGEGIRSVYSSDSVSVSDRSRLYVTSEHQHICPLVQTLRLSAFPLVSAPANVLVITHRALSYRCFNAAKSFRSETARVLSLGTISGRRKNVVKVKRHGRWSKKVEGTDTAQDQVSLSSNSGLQGRLEGNRSATVLSNSNVGRLGHAERKASNVKTQRRRAPLAADITALYSNDQRSSER